MKLKETNKASPYQRTRNLFDPNSRRPYRLSRSRLESFLNCPRCFYLDRRLGVERPDMPAFSLNIAVDGLLKKEFDTFRHLQRTPPLLQSYGIRAVPFAHPLMDEWRDPFKGIAYHHQSTNFIICGAVDDLWMDEQGQIFVVDYKATATDQPISLDSEYRQAYKRQIEIYQWLLRKQNLTVSNTGYFVYCNADKTKKTFDARLEFKIEIISHQGHDDWVESAVMDSSRCLRSEALPDYTDTCPYCRYLRGVMLFSLKKDIAKESLKPSFEVQKELF